MKLPSPYQAMWVLAMFDLPVDDKEARKHYTRFRKALLREGFMMLQYSVYGRYCTSEASSQVNRNRIRAALPPAGQVRLVSITDVQFGKMEVFQGKKRKEPEPQGEQLDLF
jgi:CRISPR-associated protein Cas2